MASMDVQPQHERLSFARIAAAGLKSTATAMQTSSTSSQDAREGHNVMFDHNQLGEGLQAMTIAHSSPPEIGDSCRENSTSEAVTSVDMPVIVGAVARALASSDSGMRSSVDGKSNSVTTFAMDEKESIRPDDSASMKAAIEDEDSTSVPGTAPLESEQASDGDARAFQEQLNEISNPQTRIVPGAAFEALPNHSFIPIAVDGTMAHDMPPDIKLIEALDNPRDRIMVLKLEQDIIDFIKDANESSLILPQCNSFYRMLAHKLADYYMLGHAVDESNTAVQLLKTPGTRIARPLTGVITPSTAASTPPPSTMQMKILRRGVDVTGPAIANGSNGRSKNTSENGESSTEEEHRRATREERLAKYELARLRIMGAARPAESDVPKEKDGSRSSSVTGKRKKKQRSDSNDDFEARSAYSSYITPSTNSAFAPASYAYGPHYAMPMSPTSPGSFEYPQSGQGYWYPQPLQPMGQPMMWTQPAQYDMARDFDRTPSFQQQAGPMYAAPQQRMQYEQQAYIPTAYPWPNGVNAMSGQYPAQPAYASNAYYEQPTSEVSQTEPYAYGQLPSQALGRPPNALEHPLPGSYRSRHFNPQSLIFVPGHSNGDTPHVYSPQRTYAEVYKSSFGDRQIASPSQFPSAESPLRPQPNGHRTQPPAPLTHPLPQPVFASQQTANTSLPPKPLTTQASSTEQPIHSPLQNSNGESTLAKWGTPTSLPAKPPPRISDSHDTPRLPVTPQRARNHVTLPRMPIFGSMPPTN